jgi:hypothetical protein
MTFNLNKYEKGVGPIFACQLSIKLFVEDTTNDFAQRKYTETIYEWLGLYEGSIDELCEVSYDKSVFILKTLNKYEINTVNSNLLLNCGEAVSSLNYQFELIKKHTLPPLRI